MKKPRVTTKRRFAKKRFTRFKRFKPVNSGIYKIKRWTSPNNMTLQNRGASVGTFNQSNGLWLCTTAAAPAIPAYYPFSLGFCLNDIPDPTEFTNLWDQYRLTGVKIKILPVNIGSENPSESGAASYLTNGGFLHMAPDYDDMTLPTSSEAGINELRSKTGYKVRNLSSQRGLSIYLRPSTTGAVYNGSVLSSYAQNSRAIWMDSAARDQIYYGLKGMIEVVQQGGVAANHIFKVEACYYFQFKNVR